MTKQKKLIIKNCFYLDSPLGGQILPEDLLQPQGPLEGNHMLMHGNDLLPLCMLRKVLVEVRQEVPHFVQFVKIRRASGRLKSTVRQVKAADNLSEPILRHDAGDRGDVHRLLPEQVDAGQPDHTHVHEDAQGLADFSQSDRWNKPALRRSLDVGLLPQQVQVVRPEQLEENVDGKAAVLEVLWPDVDVGGRHLLRG